MEEMTPVVEQPTKATAPNFILPPHKNKMAMSVICTIFCCLLGGILAIINSSKSNQLYNSAMLSSEDTLRRSLYLQSEEKNKSAQTWITLCIILGVVYVIAIIILAATGVLADYI